MVRVRVTYCTLCFVFCFFPLSINTYRPRQPFCFHLHIKTCFTFCKMASHDTHWLTLLMKEKGKIITHLISTFFVFLFCFVVATFISAYCSFKYNEKRTCAELGTVEFKSTINISQCCKSNMCYSELKYYPTPFPSEHFCPNLPNLKFAFRR